jgi:hypothetical protein
VSTFYELPDSGKTARLESVRLSVYKIDHLEELVQDLDLNARAEDLKALNASNGAKDQESVDE